MEGLVGYIQLKLAKEILLTNTEHACHLANSLSTDSCPEGSCGGGALFDDVVAAVCEYYDQGPGSTRSA